MSKHAQHLTYEVWLEHLEEKERQKKPTPDVGTKEFYLALFARFADVSSVS